MEDICASLMKKLMKRFLKDEQGLELSEYAIMAGMIIIVAVLTILAVGGKINGIFSALDTQLGNVPVTP